MKSKILIFLFTILTFGLFLIPNTFAKKYVINDLNVVNRVNNISNNGSNICWVRLDTSNISGNGNYYVSLSAFDSNGNNLDFFNFGLAFYNFSQGSCSIVRENNCYYIKVDSFSSFSGTFEFGLGVLNSTYFNDIVNNNIVFNGFVYRSTSSSASYMYSNYFVPNEYYGLSTGAYGVFASSQVQLRYYGSSSYTDISDSCLFYNTFQFNDYYVNLINNTNNVNGNGNYYIRFYFNNKVKNLSNFNLSYLELMAMRGNNTLYNDLTSIRNALPIISSNITLYNSNATLFSTSDLVNSGYGDFYIEYIDFRIADYAFKSSTYYNSGLGIRGYLSATKISALSVNALDAYNTGFTDGQRVATEDAYNNGFNAGVASNRTSFDNMMLSVANVPMTIISSMLGFEVLGVNLLGFFMGIITLLLFVKLMRKFKE